MNPRTLLLGLAALLTAGITAFLVNGWMQRQRANNLPKPPPPKAQVLQVLVAQKNLGPGTFLKRSDLRWQAWPEGTLLPVYAVKGKRRQKDFEGSVVRTAIVEGQPVTDDNVVKVGDRGFLAAVLTPGLRAVSFPITAASGIAGLVFPGDRVDLILSHKIKRASGSSRKVRIRIASETVLTNVRVLAIDQRTDDKKAKGRRSAVGKTVTVEVSPKQAEMVAVALNLGKLSLSLRSLGRTDGKSEMVQKNARGRSLTMDGEVSRLLSVQEAADSITVIRGGKSSKGFVEKGKK